VKFKKVLIKSLRFICTIFSLTFFSCSLRAKRRSKRARKVSYLYLTRTICIGIYGTEFCRLIRKIYILSHDPYFHKRALLKKTFKENSACRGVLPKNCLFCLVATAILLFYPIEYIGSIYEWIMVMQMNKYSK